MMFLRALLFSLFSLKFKCYDTDKTLIKQEITKMEDKFPFVVFTMEPIGSLQVYTWQSFAEAAANNPIKDFFWRDAGSPQGYGPFVSINAAMEHHKWLLGQAKRPALETCKPNVIRVDFRNKKVVE